MIGETKLEIMSVRVETGTFARIDDLLDEDELRSTFIRVAVKAEMRRREQRKEKALAERRLRRRSARTRELATA